MLELVALSKRFGGVRAVDNLHMTVAKGKVHGLIGPNGSGKSTLVNLICGLFPPTAGKTLFLGRDIGALPTHERLAAGIARTFQNIRLFSQLTVWQNLWMAQNSAAARAGKGFFRHWLGGSRQAREDTGAMLEFSGLAHRRDDLAGNLAFGEQRRLELARALAAKPALLLLDEPAAGMNPEEIAELDGRLQQLRTQGYTILLIEHHMELVMAVADRISVLNFGEKIAEGTPAEIQADRRVREAYLGAAGAA